MNVSPIVFDCETIPHPDAECWLEPVTAARNLKDPAKIEADLAQRTEERRGKLGLDWYTSRICALAWWTADQGCQVRTCPSEAREAVAIEEFWAAARHRLLVGFNCKGFDVPLLITRSRLLGIPAPDLDVGRYARSEIVDLYHRLTFNEIPTTACMRRTLRALCVRFGMAVTDPVIGADIAGLVAAKDWQAVADHVRSDVELTRDLAERIGML